MSKRIVADLRSWREPSGANNLHREPSTDSRTDVWEVAITAAAVLADAAAVLLDAQRAT